MTEQQIAALYLKELGAAMEAFTGVMRAALVAALRWQVANREMPTEQAEQIVMNTGAALTAALKGMHQKMSAEQAKDTKTKADPADTPAHTNSTNLVGTPVPTNKASVPSVPLGSTLATYERDE